MRARTAIALVLAATGAAPAACVAGDAAVRSALERGLPGVDAAAARLDAGDPGSVQALYDAARDREEALARAAPAGPSCRALLAAARSHARGRVRQAEGIDRLSRTASAAGGTAAAAARRRLDAARPGCRGDARPAAPARLALSPGPGEASFGALVARAPSGATAADVLVDGRPAGPATLRGGRARARLAAAPGAHDLEVRFRAGARALGSVAASGVRLLPADAAAAVPGRRTDPELGSRLGRLLRGFDGQAGAWVQDLASGRTAESNATARFPAASTVKLALLIGALARLGPGPSPLRADLREMAVWSSNLATNRVLERLGGSERGGARLAQEVLLSLGARSSTFTGGYIVGTELQPGLPAGSAPDPPPAVSGRVTTARDLARLLYAIHAAAAGVPQARRETGLTVRSARLALGWLLASEQRGDNASLVAGGLPPGTPVAQKNGWLRAARHAAALVYGPSGPRIVVLLAYRDGGLTRTAATRLGGRLARLGTA